MNKKKSVIYFVGAITLTIFGLICSLESFGASGLLLMWMGFAEVGQNE